jgi:hypothetical protein
VFLRLPGKVLSLDRLHASDPEPAGPGVHPLVDAVHVVAPISHILEQETTTFKVGLLCMFGGFFYSPYLEAHGGVGRGDVSAALARLILVSHVPERA